MRKGKPQQSVASLFRVYCFPGLTFRLICWNSSTWNRMRCSSLRYQSQVSIVTKYKTCLNVEHSWKGIQKREKGKPTISGIRIFHWKNMTDSKWRTIECANAYSLTVFVWVSGRWSSESACKTTAPFSGWTPASDLRAGTSGRTWDDKHRSCCEHQKS